MSINPVARRWLLGVAAAALGVASVRPAMHGVLEQTAVRAGPWSTVPAAGGADANLYERAAIAVAGLYALSREEAVYYTAFSDSSGRTLDARCDYTLVGSPPPSRWWSFTLYGADHYLVPNMPGIHSRHAGNIGAEADGTFRISVSARQQRRNWLPAPRSGAFSITARLYNPAAAVLQDPSAVALPAIERGECR